MKREWGFKRALKEALGGMEANFTLGVSVHRGTGMAPVVVTCNHCFETIFEKVLSPGEDLTKMLPKACPHCQGRG